MNRFQKPAITLLGGACFVILAVGILNWKKKVAEKEDEVDVVKKKQSVDVDEVRDEIDREGLENRVLRKAETVIQGRTSRILVVVERCTDDHNYSAIIRTCEALGIQHIWLIDPLTSAGRNEPLVPISGSKYLGVSISGSSSNAKKWSAAITVGGMSIPLGKFDSEDDAARAYDVQADVYGKPRNFLQGALGDGPSVKQLPNRYEHGMFARMATEWVTLREFETTRECIAALRDDGRAIWVTDLSQKAICLTREGLGAPEGAGRDDVVPGRLAVVFGTESVGCTEEMLAAADRRVYLPLRGFADSLNLSVAAALVVQALFHLCPAAVGAMPESERSALRAAWFPKLAAQRGGSSEQTKALTRLRARLRDVDYIRAKRDRDGPSALTEVQAAKLLAEPEVRAMEAALAAELAAHAAASVGPWLHHPPSTLADVRRADEHRTAFVGPGVRKSNAAHWAGMAATANDGGKPHPGAIKSPLLVD